MSVRVTAEERKQLDHLAEQTGLSRADIIRRAVVAVISYCKAHKGKMPLPVKLDE